MGCLREGKNRQEAGRTGQTITTWTHRDEIKLHAQLELRLRKDEQEEGVTCTPEQKAAQRNGGASMQGFDAFCLYH